MSIQSTRELTREEAEKKAFEVFIEKHNTMFKSMTDEELEDYIEEDFYNYRIK